MEFLLDVGLKMSWFVAENEYNQEFYEGLPVKLTELASEKIGTRMCLFVCEVVFI